MERVKWPERGASSRGRTLIQSSLQAAEGTGPGARRTAPPPATEATCHDDQGDGGLNGVEQGTARHNTGRHAAADGAHGCIAQLCLAGGGGSTEKP